MQTASPDPALTVAARRAKARRAALLLGLLALGLYAGFIALQILHARRG